MSQINYHLDLAILASSAKNGFHLKAPH
jgi:hypothetical protein